MSACMQRVRLTCSCQKSLLWFFTYTRLTASYYLQIIRLWSDLTLCYHFASAYNKFFALVTPSHFLPLVALEKYCTIPRKKQGAGSLCFLSPTYSVGKNGAVFTIRFVDYRLTSELSKHDTILSLPIEI